MSTSMPVSPDLQRIYDAILQQMGASDHFIGNDESVPLDRLFPRAMNGWSAHRVLYVLEPGAEPDERPREQEYYAYVVGKTGGYEDGLRVGAAGATQPDVTITDQTHVKQHIVLFPIHPDHEDMDDLAHDQAVGFHDVTVKLAGGQARYDELQRDGNVIMRLLTNDGVASYEHDGVTLGPFKIVTDDLYTVTSKNTPKKQAAPPPARTNRKRKADDDHGAPHNADAGPSSTGSSNASSSAAGSSSHAAASAVNTPGADEVSLDARYHFSLLPDHIGRRFQHEHARIVQFNIRDVNNDLIPPWRYPVALRRGTIVLAAVGFRLWEMPAGGNSNRSSMTFQMVLKSLKVLKAADTPEDSLTTPAPQNNTATPDSTLAIAAEIANDFASFTIPTPATTEDDSAMHDATEDNHPTPSSSAKGKKRRAY